MNRQQGLFAQFIIIMGILVCITLLFPYISTAQAQEITPTPTYDPFAQPPLPPHPSGLEMGRYLFWRHCMPCHGDKGQGLTGEFRVLWLDHQDCWARGCHGGKGSNEGFPIPTIIPAVVTTDRLSRFASEADLYEFLKATHPPQYPGYLEDEEYRTLAAFVLFMNNRAIDEIIPTQIALPTSNSPIATASPITESPIDSSQRVEWQLIAGVALPILIIILVWLTLKNRRSND